jgi:hypothetical protein
MFLPLLKKLHTMKKTVIFFILLFAATFGSYAQDYREVVYLKDGSIMKGFIIEQVPNDYLKIETANGRVYTIEMYEVESITKERRTGTQNDRRQNVERYRNDNRYQNSRRLTGSRSDYYNDDDDYGYYDRYKDYSSFPNGGYKGFIDLGFSLGTRSIVGSKSYDGEDRLEFSTSHGFLFNPYIFVGLGLGFHYYTGHHDNDYNYYAYDDVVMEIPIFAHIRSHFLDKRISPFADVKLGYSVYDVTGLYFSPSAGCRFAKGSRSAFWVSLGYSIQYIDRSYYDTSASSNAVSLRVGWDF